MATLLALLSIGLVIHCETAVAQDKPVPSPNFQIERFEVGGNTLLPAEEIESLLLPFAGAEREFADIQRALEALERAYRARGYSAVQVIVPEQDITRGVVQFRVLQPKIARVTVRGQQHFDEANVRASLPAVKEGTEPNSVALARNLQILTEHPVKRTTIVLEPGKAPEEVDVVVRVVDDKPTRVVVTLDNTGTSETGHLRAGIGYQHTNLFNRDHVFTAQFVTSPDHVSDVSILGLSYRIPAYSLNSSFDLTAGRSDVDSGVVQDLFNVSGSGTILGARWNYYLPKWADADQKLTLGFDYRAYRNEVLRQGQPIVPDITVRSMSLVYAGMLRMAASQLTYSLGYWQNLPGGNDGDEAAFARSRANAKARYGLLRYGAFYLQAFADDWQFRVAFQGQHTNDALVAGEQFGVGGPDSVRGYLLREITSDKGLAAQLEVQGPEAAAWMGLGSEYRARWVAFYDWGSVRRNQALPGEVGKQSIESVGAGLRLGAGKRFGMRFDVAQVLKSAGTRDKGDVEVSAALAFEF